VLLQSTALKQVGSAMRRQSRRLLDADAEQLRPSMKPFETEALIGARTVRAFVPMAPV